MHFKLFFLKYFNFNFWFFFNKTPKLFLFKFFLNKFNKSNLYIITYGSDFKFHWHLNTDVKYFFMKLFSIDSFEDSFFKFSFFYFNQFNINNLYNFNEKDFFIDDLIEFKLNSGFFKKRFNINQIFLDRVGKIKYNDLIFFKEDFKLSVENINKLNYNALSENDYLSIYLNSLSNYDDCNFLINLSHENVTQKKDFIYSIFDFDNIDCKNFFKNLKGLQLKNFDDLDFLNHTLLDNFFDEPKNLDRRVFKKIFFSENRKIFSYFLKQKIKKNYKFNKFIKSIIKTSFFNFTMFFEFSLKNILLRSNFFFNERDLTFFLKNSYVRVNNLIVKSGLRILNIGDLIQLDFDKFYFLYYRNVIENIIKNLGKLNRYYYLSEQKKYDYDRQIKYTAPKWVQNLLYFRDDIPNYLELDYLTMSLIILYKPFFFELNVNNLKFLNFYQRRLYNWKFII